MTPCAEDGRQTLQQILGEVYDYLMDLEETEPDVPPRLLLDTFMDLPGPSDYGFYLAIKNPISMRQIGEKIKDETYQSVEEFRQDVTLLCKNWRACAEEGSVTYGDTKTIEVRTLAQ